MDPVTPPPVNQPKGNLRWFSIPQHSSVIVCICVVGFHHLRGTEVEWTYPEDCGISKDILLDIAVLAMPDQAHTRAKDSCFFRSGPYFAISCFAQKKASEVVDDHKENEITRSMVQKSVVIICSKPIYGAIHFTLDPITLAYFDQGKFNDRSILIDAYQQFNKKYKDQIQDDDTLYLGVSLQQFIQLFEENALVLYKLMWLEKRIIFYGVPSSLICNSVLAVTSLMPYMIQALNQIPPSGGKKDTRSGFSLPLMIFNKTFFQPYVALQHLDELKGMPSFLVGSSNLLFGTGSLPADLIVDQTKLKWKNKELEAALSLTSQDTKFITHVKDTVANNIQENNHGYLGSDEWIRDMFKKYTLSFLSVMVDSDFGVSKTSTGFNKKWVNLWKTTENFLTWQKGVDPQAVVRAIEPQHYATQIRSNFEQFQTKAIAQLSRYWASFTEEKATPDSTLAKSTPAKKTEIQTAFVVKHPDDDKISGSINSSPRYSPRSPTGHVSPTRTKETTSSDSPRRRSLSVTDRSSRIPAGFQHKRNLIESDSEDNLQSPTTPSQENTRERSRTVSSISRFDRSKRMAITPIQAPHQSHSPRTRDESEPLETERDRQTPS